MKKRNVIVAALLAVAVVGASNRRILRVPCDESSGDNGICGQRSEQRVLGRQYDA